MVHCARIAQVARHFVFKNANSFLCRAHAHSHHRFFGNPGHMRRYDHVRKAEIGVIRRQWLLGENVQGGATDPTVVDQLCLVGKQVARFARVVDRAGR